MALRILVDRMFSALKLDRCVHNNQLRFPSIKFITYACIYLDLHE